MRKRNLSKFIFPIVRALIFLASLALIIFLANYLYKISEEFLAEEIFEAKDVEIGFEIEKFKKFAPRFEIEITQ